MPQNSRMAPQNFYKNRIDEYKTKADSLEKLESRLSLARLIVFLGGLGLFFVLLPFSSPIAIFLLVTCAIVFVWLVKFHSATEHSKNYYRNLEVINHREMQCLEGHFSNFPDGSEYINRDHENTYDLDIFGHASVFQYINRTTSKPAADMLAEWLKAAAPENEIRLRQQAFLELKNQTHWRQELISLGYMNEQAKADPVAILRWIRSENQFTSKNYLTIITNLLSVLSITSTILVAALEWPFAILVFIYTLNFLFYFSQSKKINGLHSQVGRSSEMLKSYSATIRLIEKQNFSSNKLRSLHSVFSGSDKVSAKIQSLSTLVNRLDARLNIMVAIPLNLFFFWDIRYCMALEKWKSANAKDISKWFEGMAEFEVLSCLANMAFNNPDWATPEVVPEYFTLNAKGAGHPLIPSVRRITNDISVSGSGRTVIITGSNMSGKSTFLRTIGVNSILAMAGAPVCAESFTVSHATIFSSMRISDSLEDNTSSFYAELKRLKNIIDTAEKNPRLLLLLDEILRGTNSNDRYTGSVALVKQLIGYRTVTLIATHDLRLADLEEDLPEQIDNYHFDVKIDGEELYFDYKLTEGICRSMNASVLMKKMGIRI